MRSRETSPNETYPIEVKITFHRHLRQFLRGEFKELESFHYQLNRRTSIKDVIESFDIPHTEVGLIYINRLEKNFSYIVQTEDCIEVQPHTPPINPCRTSYLRPVPVPTIRFLVDINVAKLGVYLRMVGMDTLYRPHLADRDLAALAAKEKCILLSKDRGLLKRKIVEHGRLVRADTPLEQLAEIIYLYGLKDKIRPFSRCIHCNSLLSPVAKNTIIQELEPLTRKYYEEFSRCLSCHKIYWRGGHRLAMESLIRKALQMAQERQREDI